MKKRYILIILLVVIVSLVFVLQLPAEAAGRLEPVSAKQPDYGSQFVVVVADERVLHPVCCAQRRRV